MYKKCVLTAEQKEAVEVACIGLMNAAPFFAYYFYSEMEEYPTKDIPTAATDGRRIFYNPDYLMPLKPMERVFVLAHEIYHVVSSHPARMKHYHSADNLRGLPWVPPFFNVCADFPINADLVAQGIGICNPAWLYDPRIKPEEIPEDIYEREFKKNPPPPPPPPQGGGKGQGNGQGTPPPGQAHGQPNQPGQGQQRSTYGQHQKGGKPDQQAQANGGSFDEVLPPEVDPVTGKEDVPDEAEFREAIARAAAAAKAMGKMPASFQRLVDEILDPQVSWREHIRMLMTGRIGSRSETWDRLNRRRIAVSVNAISRGDPFVVLPGRRGFGAKDVAVAIDTSGSIGQKELDSFFAEVGGILTDVRPKRIYVIWCDAAVHKVDIAQSLDELRALSPVGGGGTDFRPPFEWLEENQVRPEAMVYLTDLLGPFPDEAPGYPVIWCATTDAQVPWGDVVRIKI